MIGGLELPLWQKILAVILIAVVVIWGSYNYLYKPKLAEIDSLKNTLEMIDLEIKIIVPDEKILEDEAKLKKIIKTELEELIAKIPTEAEVPFIIEKFISEVGKGLNIDYNLIQPQPVVSEGKYKRLPLKVDFISDYMDLNSYLTKLKTLPSTIRTDELDLKRTGELPKLQVHMLLSSFVMPGEAPAKAWQFQRKPYLYDPFFKPEEKAKVVIPKKKEDIVLQGIWKGKKYIAFINDKAVEVNQYINGYKVIKIEDNKVILQKDRKIYTLEFGGIR